MNVCFFDILAAYIIVFKREMSNDLPFAEGAKQIQEARQDWRRVFQACEDARIDMQRAGHEYPEVTEVARRALDRVAA